MSGHHPIPEPTTAGGHPVDHPVSTRDARPLGRAQSVQPWANTFRPGVDPAPDPEVSAILGQPHAVLKVECCGEHYEPVDYESWRHRRYGKCSACRLAIVAATQDMVDLDPRERPGMAESIAAAEEVDRFRSAYPVIFAALGKVVGPALAAIGEAAPLRLATGRIRVARNVLMSPRYSQFYKEGAPPIDLWKWLLLHDAGDLGLLGKPTPADQLNHDLARRLGHHARVQDQAALALAGGAGVVRSVFDLGEGNDGPWQLDIVTAVHGDGRRATYIRMVGGPKTPDLRTTYAAGA